MSSFERFGKNLEHNNQKSTNVKAADYYQKVNPNSNTITAESMKKEMGENRSKNKTTTVTSSVSFVAGNKSN